jgi:hypothetical protein
MCVAIVKYTHWKVAPSLPLLLSNPDWQHTMPTPAKPEFFTSTKTDSRIILTQSGTTPHVSGDLNLYTPQEGLRPLTTPRVVGGFENPITWNFEYYDPTTDNVLKLNRHGETTITLNDKHERPLREWRLIIPAPDVEERFTRYRKLCRFVLFHGTVDEQRITVISAVDKQDVVAIIGNRLVTPTDRERSDSGSLLYTFPGVCGDLYLPSSRAQYEDPTRQPVLGDQPISNCSVNKLICRVCPTPLLTRDLIE